MRVVFFLSNIIELSEEWENKAKTQFFSLTLTNILLIPNENYWNQSGDPNTCIYTFSVISHSLSSSFTSCTALCPSNLLFYFLGCIWPINTISVTGWCVFRKLRELKQTLILVHRAQLNPNRGNVHNWILWSFHFTQSKYETYIFIKITQYLSILQ